MKKIFVATAIISLFLVLLAGCSVVTQSTNEPSGNVKTTGLRSAQGSGLFCDACGKELSNRECGEDYQITFFQGRVVEKTYNLVCPDCADNIVAYIEQLKNSDEK